MFSLPKDFIARLKDFPKSYSDSILRRIEVPTKTCFRLNSLVLKDESFLVQLVDEIEFETHRIENQEYFSVDSADKEILTRNKEAGRSFYIQNPSSMLPPLILQPQTDQRILDLAAAPGSKTSLMAAIMENTGHIAAVEIVKKRFFKLKANLKRLNVTNTKVFWQNGEVVGRYRPNHFDAVLLDAPCSSEAIFHSSDAKSTKHWSTKKVHEMSRKQLALLDSAVESCAIGGHILYSTCSYSVEENEAILEKILTKFPSLTIGKTELNEVGYLNGFEISTNQEINKQLKKAIRIVPNEYHEGFFLAKLRKS